VPGRNAAAFWARSFRTGSRSCRPARGSCHSRPQRSSVSFSMLTVREPPHTSKGVFSGVSSSV